MNASDLKFFTHDIRSNDPAVQSKAFEILFGKIERDLDEDGGIIERLVNGSSIIKKPLYRIIPKTFNSHNFLDVYKIVSNQLFNHLRGMDCSNVRNIRTWLWSVAENYILRHEDEIKQELGAVDSELPVSLTASCTAVDFGTALSDNDNSVNRYLEELKNSPNGEYSTRLIEYTVLKDTSLEDFCKEENEYRTEHSLPIITDTQAISRHKYNALLSLIRISSADVKLLRKHVYLKLQQENLLDEKLRAIEHYCLHDGEIRNSQLHLVKKMFDIYNKTINESRLNTMGYYKEYHWLYNKYSESCKDNPKLSKLNDFEIKSLNLYFNKGIINNNIQFVNSIIKLGSNGKHIEAMPDKIERFNKRHEEICGLKDSPEIIEKYFIESFNEYMDNQLEKKELKQQAWSLSF